MVPAAIARLLLPPLVLTLALNMGLAYGQDTKAQIKSDFKTAGKQVAESTRPPRMAVKRAAKEVGKSAKEGGLAVGHGAKRAAKQIAAGFKKAVK